MHRPKLQCCRCYWYFQTLSQTFGEKAASTAIVIESIGLHCLGGVLVSDQYRQDRLQNGNFVTVLRNIGARVVHSNVLLARVLYVGVTSTVLFFFGEKPSSCSKVGCGLLHFLHTRFFLQLLEKRFSP